MQFRQLDKYPAQIYSTVAGRNWNDLLHTSYKTTADWNLKAVYQQSTLLANIKAESKVQTQNQGEKNRPQRYLISFAKANIRQDWVFDKVCIFFVTQNVWRKKLPLSNKIICFKT